MSEIRVLVVDDSMLMRKLITDLLQTDSRIKVVDTARNGAEGVRKVKELKPDVVTMDIEMPVMDGLTALEKIIAENPVPVLMLSALDKREADITVKALNAGAVDFIPKPSGTLSLDVDKLKETLISKVKMAAEINAKKLKPVNLPKTPIVDSSPKIKSKKELKKKVVVIGASTGGPKALTELLGYLPRDLPAPVLVVQHMPEGFTKSFAERLNMCTSIEIKEAEEGDELRNGLVLIAPGNKHMVIENMRIKLTDGAKVNCVRPSVDVTMESAVSVFGDGCIGVLLTGMGSDGALGLKKIKEKGGKTFVQDESSCVVFGMPKMALDLGAADKALSLRAIAEEIIDAVR